MDPQEFERRLHWSRIGLVLVFLAIAIVAAVVITSGHRRYPPAVQTDIVAGCMDGGASTSSCVCYLHTIEARFTLTQFNRLAAKQPVAPELLEITRECAGR
jgi:hypothetical protein